MSSNQGPASERWSRLIDEFRSFGGIADNVIQRQGRLGLGLFPMDPSQPIELHAPGHLLIATDNLELRDNQVQIKNKTYFPEGYADWYQRFQREYSWGAEASRSIIEFESELQKLPDSIQQILNQFLPVPIKQRLPRIDIENEIFKRFILTRQINWNGKNVLMPIIELVNHSPAQNSWGVSDRGISIEGQFQDEVLVRYSASDPMHRFIQYGFACDESMGFSMSLMLNHRGHEIQINGGINFSPFKPMPSAIKSGRLVINKPLLGSSNRPRMPKALFAKSCEQFKNIDSNELFEQVCHLNRIGIIKIMKALQENNFKSPLKDQLQETCWLQLNAIGEHYGKRDDLNDQTSA